MCTKKIRWAGGRISPVDLHIITQAATRARKLPLDFMVSMTRLVIERASEMPVKPDMEMTLSNRRSTIVKYITRYLEQSKERDELYGETYLLRQRIAELTVGATDLFSLANSNAEYHELINDLAEYENRLANPHLGEGLLQDITNLLNDEFTYPVSEIGSDTHFLLSTIHGTVPVPLKIRGEHVWLGGLPLRSLVIINNVKVVI